MLMWLDNPNVEGGPLKSLLKSFAGQNSHKHRHNDGKHLRFDLFKHQPVYFIQRQSNTFPRSAARTGFLHIAEALEHHRDTEVPLRAVIAMLKAGDRCNAEAELIGKGISRIMVGTILFELSLNLAFQTLVK